MFFKNVELYNVQEIMPEEDNGYKMLRVPDAVRVTLNEAAQKAAFAGSGTEIRFKMIGDEVRLTLSLPEERKSANAWLYHGTFQGDWEQGVQYIFNTPTEITIKKPMHMEVMKEIYKKDGLSFNPEVFRLMLPLSGARIIDVCGECCPPCAEDVPRRRYLAHGSSITHGSSGLVPINTYAMRTASKLNADLINLGFAGSCHIEGSMADYIASRNDWDFATLELGINIAEAIGEEEFYKRSKYFIETIAKAHPDKLILCIDLFTFLKDVNSNEDFFFRRVIGRIVDELNMPKVRYMSGKDALTTYLGLSADMVHPSIAGMEEVSDNLVREIRKYL